MLMSHHKVTTCAGWAAQVHHTELHHTRLHHTAVTSSGAISLSVAPRLTVGTVSPPAMSSRAWNSMGEEDLRSVQECVVSHKGHTNEV